MKAGIFNPLERIRAFSNDSDGDDLEGNDVEEDLQILSIEKRADVLDSKRNLTYPDYSFLEYPRKVKFSNYGFSLLGAGDSLSLIEYDGKKFFFSGVGEHQQYPYWKPNYSLAEARVVFTRDGTSTTHLIPTKPLRLKTI